MSDLPAMGQKTIEASLKVLKDLELIECKMVEVSQWRGDTKYRGVKLTKKGAEYNANLVLPSQDERVNELKKEVKELKQIIESLTVSNTNTPIPQKEKIVLSMPTVQAIELFIETITKRFGKTGQSICNGVPKWDKETTFYINSYNRLSIITPENKHKQLKDPSEIKAFWEWLSTHSSRVGKIIDFEKSPTIKELESYFVGQTIILGKNIEKICEFVEVKGGVKIRVESQTGEVRFIIDKITKKDKVFELSSVLGVLFGVLG